MLHKLFGTDSQKPPPVCSSSYLASINFASPPLALTSLTTESLLLRYNTTKIITDCTVTPCCLIGLTSQDCYLASERQRSLVIANLI